MLVDRRASHAEHLGDIVGRALPLERALRVQRLDELAPVFARERVERNLPLAQPSVQKGVDASCQSSLKSSTGCPTTPALRRKRSSVERLSSKAAILKLMHITPAALPASSKSAVLTQRMRRPSHERDHSPVA